MNDRNCAATPRDTIRILNRRRSIIGVAARSSQRIKQATRAISSRTPARTGGYSQPSLGAVVMTSRNVIRAVVDRAAPGQSKEAPRSSLREKRLPSRTRAAAAMASRARMTPQ